MSLTYSIKLLLSNFSNTWKVLLYKIFILLCSLGLTTVVSWDIISLLIQEGFFVELGSTMESILFNFHIEDIIVSVNGIFSDLVSILTTAGMQTQAIFLGLFGIVIFYFLNGLYELALTYEISGYMSSLTPYGFLNCYISWLGKSIWYQVIRLVTSLLVNLAVLVGAYFILINLVTVAGGFLALFVTLSFAVFGLSIKYTIFSCWAPAIIVNDISVFAGLKKGLKAVFKRFVRTWSSAIVLLLSLMLINGFALSITVGVGLFITMPLSSLLLVIFNNVTYFTAMGMRFYVDNDTIITPKTLEEQDQFKKVKNII